jgi:hypothetical protein
MELLDRQALLELQVLLVRQAPQVLQEQQEPQA